MKNYEVMFIVKTTLEEAAVKNVVESLKSTVTDLNGKITNVKEMGQRTLAYPINKELNGYYFVMQVEADKDIINEFDRKIRLDENVLRHLIIRLDEE